MMTQDESTKRTRYTGYGKHPLGDRLTARLLRSLPTFKVVHDIPEHLADLLRRLEEAERERSPGDRIGVK